MTAAGGLAPSPRFAIAGVFLAYGLMMGLWAGSIPTVTARAGIDAAMLGAGFALFTAVYILGMVATGPLARSIPMRTLLLIVLPVHAATLTALLFAPSVPAFLVAIAAFGLTGGLLDAKMNTEGMSVERDLGRTVLASFHGLASLGFGLFSIAGSFVSVTFGLTVTAILAIVIAGGAILLVLRGTPRRGVPTTSGAASFRFPLIIVLLGVIMGVSSASEMAAAMFSSPYLDAIAPEFAAYAGAGGSAFALAQAAMRFIADRLRARFGDPVLLTASVLVAAAGFALVSTAQSFPVIALGFIIVGIGSACVSPCAFALATQVPGLTAAGAIAAMSLVTAIPRIPTPWIFGEVAAGWSYPVAFGLYGGLLVIAAVASLVLALPRGAAKS